ncbi:MAG: MBOAT family protein, partial [Oscillospiraceae bacterium]|nr:MBOAT family protein [Oscillospiraceae bacterium]
QKRKMSLAKFSGGCRLFLVGLAKKMLLSNTIGVTYNALAALEVGSLSVVSAWIGALAYTLMLYFDFSGYSDMAIGLSRMFGFNFDKNFDYPYAADSISDFWRRWHISLGAWFREYVYIPLGGNRAGMLKTLRNLGIVWLFTGIWHGANWTFIVWGLYHGAISMLEKFVLKDILKKIPHGVKVLVTFLLVLIGWVFFFSPNLGSAFAWLGKMFGIGAAGFLDGTAKYYLGSTWLLFVIGLVGSFPTVSTIAAGACRGKTGTVITVAWYALLLVLCIAAMTGSTYSSFLYFQF